MNMHEHTCRILRNGVVDHRTAELMLMMVAAHHVAIRFVDYTRDGLKMAGAQLKNQRKGIYI